MASQRKPEPKPKSNVQKISAKKHNEGPRISVVTCKGSRIGDDMKNGWKHIEQWVRKLAGYCMKRSMDNKIHVNEVLGR
jgi:hypothetical protein